MTKTVNVAIMGIGTVGGGTYEILTENREFMLRTQGIDFRVKKVLDKNLERIRSFGIPESAAASSVVPEPAKGSKTNSPSREAQRTMRVSRARGFCVS